MEPARIAELLQPFLGQSTSVSPCYSERSEESGVLTSAQLQNISTYIDLLLRWNARINLTAVRQPEQVVTRHFGESLFAARHLFPRMAQPASFSHANNLNEGPAAGGQQPTTDDRPLVIDLGSGAGFPGLPIKIWAPHIELTLIESNHKKATFLREVVRALALTDVNVFCGRAEDYSASANVVTLRAVERFEQALLIAARLVAPAGRLALLIGTNQVAVTAELIPEFQWSAPIPVPQSTRRILLVGTPPIRGNQVNHVS